MTTDIHIVRRGSVQAKSANYTALTTDATVLATAGASGITITTAAPSPGQRLEVKKVDSAVGLVTVSPASGTIDGASSYLVTSPYECVTLVSNGTDWFVV